MATTKISALPAASSADATDLTIVVTDIGGGALQDQKATVTQAATYSRALTGATTASAITGSGSSLIINTALANSDTRIAGTTSATLFFVDAGLDKVGIATAVPTEKLDVTGTVNATLFAGSGASLTGLGTTSTAFRTVASDPSPLIAGDVWYNSTSDTFKCGQGVDAFAVSSSISTNRALHNGAGTAAAAVVFGGETSTSAFTLTTEKWSGTAWSSTGSISGNRHYAMGCGTSSAALVCGGYSVFGSPYTSSSPNSQTYNGTSWTTTGSQSYHRSSGGIFGTSTSVLVFSGHSSAGYTATSESFNGSTWASSTSYVNAEEGIWSNAGTSSTSGITTGRSGFTAMHSYNGIAWSSASSRTQMIGWGCGGGTATAAIGIGGTNNGSGTGAVATSERYDGSTWAAGATMGTARFGPGGGGTASNSVLVTAGKTNTTYQSSTEILSTSSVAAKTFTVA